MTGDDGTVFVPLHELPADGEAVCELRSLDDGRLALPVYDSMDQLVECCGQGQPWMEVPADRIDALQAATGAEVVVTGARLAPDRRHPIDDDASATSPASATLPE